jgi:hypothetical protein
VSTINFNEVRKVNGVSVNDSPTPPKIPSKTPIDPIKNIAGVSVGMNLIQPYKEDSALKGFGKGLINYVGGTVGRIVEAPFQALANTSEAGESLLTGKPVVIGEKNLIKDVLGAEKQFNALKQNHPILGIAAEGIVSGALDPSTYIGGGVLDDMVKAGAIGKNAVKGTTENMVLNAERNVKAVVKPVKAIEKPVAKKLPAIIPKEEVELVKKYSTVLPDNEQELTKLVNTLEQQQQKGIKINLQLFAEAKKKLSQFRTGTLTKSPFLQDADVQKVIDDIDMTYKVKTNKDTIKKVTDELENDFNSVVDRIKKEGLHTKEDSTAAGLITRELVQKAKETGDYSKVKEWIGITRPEVTNIAQTLQGLTTWKELTPEGALMKAQQVVDATNKELEKTMGKLAKKVELTNEDYDFISKQMDKVQKMPDGRGKDVEFAKVKQLIANKVPPTLSEKILGAQRIAMLLNPKSMTRNVLGNTIFGTIDNISNAVATPIDFAVGKLTGKRTTTLPSIRGQLKSGLQGAKDAIQDAKLGIDTSPSRSQFELPNKTIFQGNDLFNRSMNKLDQITKAGLQLGDRPFYKAAYDDVLRQQMKLAKVDKPTEAMMEQAKKIAEQRTYQDVNALTEAFKRAQKALNLGKDIGIGNAVLPFTKTPANILKRAIEYSPAGVSDAIKEALNIKKGLFDQKKFVDSLSRSVTGTALIMVGYDLAKKGIITGKGNKDKDVAALERNMGKSDYAFHVGDKYYTYDWMQPSSMALAIGADIFNNGKNREAAANTVIEAIKSGGETLLKQSLLQGLQRFMGGYSTMDNLQETLVNVPSMFVPTALKQVAQLTDGTQRNIQDGDVLKQGANLIKSKLPIASKSLQPKIDTFGNEVKAYQGKNNIFNVLFNPGFSTEFKPNETQKEILRIYKSTGNKDQFPRVAPKSFTWRGENIKLTPEEYTQYQRTLGKLTEEKFRNIMEQKTYQLYADEAKAKRLQGILTDVNERAKREILRQRGLVK